jgi:ferredoxin
MRFEVDQEVCAGHAMCNLVAGGVYALNADGFAVESGEVPAGLESEARTGVTSCPERAIRLVS